MHHSLRSLVLRLAIVIGLCLLTPLSAAQAAPRADTALPPIAVGPQPYAVAVNPVWVSFCARRLNETPVKVATVVGFPLGASTARMKLEEAREALRNGATELDVVMNIGALRSGFATFAEREIAAIVATAERVPVRVIIEACFLSRDEKAQAGELCVRAGAAGIQTATGYGTTGATLEDVTLLREATRGRLVIKAAGGIRTFGAAADFIAAGARRIGTSAGAEILAQAPPDTPPQTRYPATGLPTISMNTRRRSPSSSSAICVRMSLSASKVV